MKKTGLPEGTLSVGGGLAITGIASYLFLIVSARSLDPEGYAYLSVLWALVFLCGPGFFFPLEQEISRALAARKAAGLGGRPVLVRGAILGGILAVFLLALAFLVSPALMGPLLRGDRLLGAAFLLSLIGYFAQHFVRGFLSGNSIFGGYAAVIVGEGAVRLIVCLALAAFGVSAVGPYGLALGAAPLVSALFWFVSPKRVEPGPPAQWSELTRAFGFLLAGSAFAQFLINAGPLAVRLLSEPENEAAAGSFLSGLIVARVPLFLFSAVQAVFLPKLSSLAATGRHGDLVESLKRLVGLVVGLGAAATIGGYAIGPWIVTVLFGTQFRLGRSDLAYLAAGSAFYMLALAVAQALIALSAHSRVAVGWLAGCVVFVVVTAAFSELLLRVELGFLAGSAVAAATMGALFLSVLEKARATAADRLFEAAHEVPIEP